MAIIIMSILIMSLIIMSIILVTYNYDNYTRNLISVNKTLLKKGPVKLYDTKPFHALCSSSFVPAVLQRC